MINDQRREKISEKEAVEFSDMNEQIDSRKVLAIKGESGSGNLF